MAEKNVNKNPSETARQENRPSAQTTQPSSAGQTTRQGQEPRGGGLARRSEFFPSLFSLSPREFFSTSPFELMRRFSDEMDRAFQSWGLGPGARGQAEAAAWSPALEVFERGGNLVVRAELPGLTKDDVKVEVTDDRLILQGERKHEQEERREGRYHSEWSYGQFYRQIPLPEGAKIDETRAQFNNGVLEVSIPVPETQRRQIPVETTGKEGTQATAKMEAAAQGQSAAQRSGQR
jgi:HSP20 family protein